MKGFIERIKNNDIRSNDKRYIEGILFGSDDPTKPSLAYVYLKYFSEIDVSRVVDLLCISRDPELSSELISGMARIEYSGTKMQQVVLEIARGKEWDRDCVAMISAILNIPHFVPLESARETLLLGSRHVNPIVRDAVATAIQVYAGVPKQEILWGTGSGTLMSIINTSIAKLLDPKGD